jgi:hypothetical protein
MSSGEATQVNNLEKDMNESMKEERKFLEKLAKRSGGVLLVDEVLAVASDPKCVLHKHFQWDDTKAAESFRKMQARQLIQKCVVTIEKAPDVQVRAFVSMAADQNAGGGYRMMVDVLSDDDLKAQLLHEMQVALIKWKKQINLLDKETAAIIDKLEEVLEKKVKGKELVSSRTR